MLQCGGCSVSQVVPILSNPITWLLALAAVSSVVGKVSKKKETK
jgi:hypothetical protein